MHDSLNSLPAPVARMNHLTRQLFEAHDLRCTRQRLLVFDTLASVDCHPTAEELHRRIAGDGDDRLSLSTVYNSLELLCRVGLIRKVATVDGVSRYDADITPHMHIRFADSGRIVDVPRELGDALLNHLPRPILARIEAACGGSIDGINIQFTARDHAAPTEPSGGWPVRFAARLKRASGHESGIACISASR